jgi:prepilin-type N-terminal cleavage/methylation domain-containing protein
MSAMSTLHDERGFSLPELLVAMTLMIVVLTATLTTLDSSHQNRSLLNSRTDAVETARSAIDTVVRQLRNLASPSAATPSAIDRALPTDFAFRTFDPTRKIVRYCVSDDTVAARQNVVYQMVQDTLTTPGSYTTCRTSTTGWSRITAVAANIVNERAPNSIDVFAYNGSPSTTSTITNVRVNLVVDVNASTKRPTQIRLASGAALRNQNQAPTARFSVTNPSPRRFQLNATTSSDPEDRTLIYTWYAAPTSTFTVSASNQIGVGPVLDYTFPSTTASGSNYYFKLVVSDSNLSDMCPTSAGSTTNCATAGPKTI